MPLSVFHERAWLSRAWAHAWEWPVHAHCSTRAATTAFATAQTLSLCTVPLRCADLQPLRPRPALLHRRVLHAGQKLRPAHRSQTLPGQPQRPPRPRQTPEAMARPATNSDASGSPAPPCADVLPPSETTAASPDANQHCKCQFCGHVVSAFVRQDPNKRTASVRTDEGQNSNVSPGLLRKTATRWTSAKSAPGSVPLNPSTTPPAPPHPAPPSRLGR